MIVEKGPTTGKPKYVKLAVEEFFPALRNKLEVDIIGGERMALIRFTNGNEEVIIDLLTDLITMEEDGTLGHCIRIKPYAPVDDWYEYIKPRGHS